MIYHQDFFGGTAARAALVSSSSLLHVRTARPTSPYSPRFLHAMLFLDFTLSIIESELRIVYFCRNRAKEARSRRQFQIYEICCLRNNTLFPIFWKKSAQNKNLKYRVKFYEHLNTSKINFQ